MDIYPARVGCIGAACCIVKLTVVVTLMPQDDDATVDFALPDLVRALGLHRPDRIPCGQPFSPPEAMTLLLLDDRGTLAQQDITADLEKSTVSRLLDGMAPRGLVERGPHPDDGRRYLVALTDDGTRQVGTLRTARRQRLGRLLGAIAAADRAAVVKVIHQLTSAGHATR